MKEANHQPNWDVIDVLFDQLTCVYVLVLKLFKRIVHYENSLGAPVSLRKTKPSMWSVQLSVYKGRFPLQPQYRTVPYRNVSYFFVS